MVEGAALEMLCTERYLGFESLTLRQTEVSDCLPLFFFLSGFLQIVVACRQFGQISSVMEQSTVQSAG